MMKAGDAVRVAKWHYIYAGAVGILIRPVFSTPNNRDKAWYVLLSNGVRKNFMTKNLQTLEEVNGKHILEQ